MDVATRVIADDELEERYGEYEVERDDTGCKMVRLPKCGKDAIGIDFVFSARLPMLRDGSLIDPMKMYPLSSDQFAAILPGVRLLGGVAWVLYGDYDDNLKEFCLTRHEGPGHVLVKITWDVELMAEENGDYECESDLGARYENAAKEKLGSALILTKSFYETPYKLRGVTYVLRKTNIWAETFYEGRQKALAALLRYSTKELDKFTTERAEWEERMLLLIPGEWSEMPTRRLMRSRDGLKLTVQVSPGRWRLVLDVRYDVVGYGELQKYLSGE